MWQSGRRVIKRAKVRRITFVKSGHRHPEQTILNPMAINRLNTEVIMAAIEGFEVQKSRIDAQIAELREMLAGNQPDANASTALRATARRKMSAVARKRIGDAQRKRWAASKGNTAPATKAAKPKRKLSAAGRANIVAALKKRWAAKKAGSKKVSKQAGPQKVPTKSA